MDIEVFNELPIIGILRGICQNDVAPLTDAIQQSGLKTLEVTMNTLNAPSLIKGFVQRADKKLMVGAGTVLTMEDLEAALSAGASFIVSPIVVGEMVTHCVKNGIPIFPGALTPQEIFMAWQAGATMVKVFPSGFFGPRYFQNIKGPLNNIKLLACSGVTADNIKVYFSKGADAVAFGSSIFKAEWLQRKEYQKIADEIQKLIKGYKE